MRRFYIINNMYYYYYGDFATSRCRDIAFDGVAISDMYNTRFPPFPPRRNIVVVLSRYTYIGTLYTHIQSSTGKVSTSHYYNNIIQSASRHNQNIVSRVYIIRWFTTIFILYTIAPPTDFSLSSYNRYEVRHPDRN